MIRQFLLFLICTSLFSQCVDTSGKSSSSQAVLKLNTDEIEELKLSDVVDSVRIIPLGDEHSSSVGGVRKVEVYEDKIFALDMFRSQSIAAYTRNGEFLYSIEQKGMGPGELIAPQDFAIDPYSSELVVYDAAAIKLLFYDLGDGTFIRETKLDFRVSRFDKLSESTFVFFRNNHVDVGGDYNLIVTNNNFEVLDEFFRIDKNLFNYHYLTLTNFTSYKDSLFFTQPSDNNIYHINKESFDPEVYIAIDFPGKELPDSFYKYYKSNSQRKVHMEGKASSPSPFFKTDHFTLIRYDFDDSKHHYYFRSNKTGREIHTSRDKMVVDIEYGPIPVWPIYSYENKLVFVGSPTRLFEYVELKKLNSTNEEWNAFLNNNADFISSYEKVVSSGNPYLIELMVDF